MVLYNLTNESRTLYYKTLSTLHGISSGPGVLPNLEDLIAQASSLLEIGVIVFCRHSDITEQFDYIVFPDFSFASIDMAKLLLSSNKRWVL